MKSFVAALFKHATPDTWVSLRSFPDKGSKEDRPTKITAHQLNGNLDALIDKALHDAELAANAEEKIVFAPPIATFKKGYFAREDNLAEGLVINAECDTHAQEARAKLERLLGPATVVVESGGEWVDPDTGELKPRLHVHYRLKVPARGEEALAKLRLARKLATAIVGGDASNINAVHPIRWAGSWHRKGEPKLARIVSLNADAEIDLDEALEILQQAAPSVECAEPASNEDKQADPDLIYAAMVVIPNNDVSRDEWNKKGMAIFAATGGHQRGFEAFAMWSKKSSKSHGGHVKRWKNYRRHPPTKISAGSIIYWANEADPTGQWRADYDKKREAIDAKLVEPLLANFAAKQAAAEPKDEAKVDEPIGIKDASDPWPTINEAAYYGFAGEVVQTIAPHSEADPIALLLQFLVCFGNAVGRSRYYQVESDRHYANLFADLVGSSSSGRKGTSFGRIRAIFKTAAEEWARERIGGGLSSGEGVIFAVRDRTTKTNDDGEEVIADHGVSDKRLLIVEPEFAGVLAVMERGGNIISKLLREAWDRGDLRSMTKNPQKATNAHISIIGHITKEELCSRLTMTDMANGFANRFLFALVKRSKVLPFGGNLSDSQIEDLGLGLMAIIAAAIVDKPPRLTWTEPAAQEWAKVYGALTAERGGLFGAITARGAPQVARLALIYALLDCTNQIDAQHLKAALAVWNYCDESARQIFGDTLGDDTADAILQALRAADEGLSRNDLVDMFGRHRSRGRMDAALKLLVEKGLAYAESRPTKGRPSEIWHATKS